MDWRLVSSYRVRYPERTYPANYTSEFCAVQIVVPSAPLTWYRAGWITFEWREQDLGRVVSTPSIPLTLGERCILTVPTVIVLPYRLRYTSLSWLIAAKANLKVWQG